MTKLQAKRLRGLEGGDERNLLKIRTNLKELSQFLASQAPLSFVPDEMDGKIKTTRTRTAHVSSGNSSEFPH